MTRKIKRKDAKILASILSYKSSGILDELDLSKVQALTLCKVKWIKCMLESGKLPENIRRTFLQYLKPAFKRAVADSTENEKDASSSETEESNKEESNEKESGKGESTLYTCMGDQSSSDH